MTDLLPLAAFGAVCAAWGVCLALVRPRPAIPAELSKEMEWSPATDVSETPTEYLVKADYKDGVLNVHLPKMSVETPKPVKIAVQ